MPLLSEPGKLSTFVPNPLVREGSSVTVPRLMMRAMRTSDVAVEPGAALSAAPTAPTVAWQNVVARASTDTKSRGTWCSSLSACQARCIKSLGVSEIKSRQAPGFVAHWASTRQIAVPSNARCGRPARWLQSLLATVVFDAVVLVNTIAVLIQLANEVDPVPGQPSNDSGLADSMRLLQYVLLGVFVLEVCAKAIVFGPLAYWKQSIASKVDILLVFAALVGTILELSGVVNRQISAVLSFFRFIRLVRILRIIPGFGVTVAAFGDILPVLGQYATVLFCVFYFFAVIGMLSFSGVLSPSNPAVVQSSYGQNDVYAINYDTFHGAMVSNLYLLVMNDWPVLSDGVAAATNTQASIIYYLGFWLVNLVLVLNVLVAFVIDSFTTQKAKRETLQWMHDTGMDPHFGIEDWRQLVVNSGLDFSEFRISKKSHHFYVYDELYKEEVRAKYADTFNARRHHAASPRLAHGDAAAQ